MNSLFIKHADFIFKPFEQYFNDFIYVWRDYSSTPGPDGLIRLPFRLPFILSNWLVGPNLSAYFYILFIFAFSFGAMYLFLRIFLPRISRFAAVAASLFFAVNPVFLGNGAKIGLQLGVACLPLILVCARKYIHKPHLAWAVWMLILLLASFVHPFTLFVNAVTLFGFLVFHIKEVKLKHAVAAFFIGLGLSAYIILPLYSIGSVGKVQTGVSESDSGQSGLIDIARTDNLLEGFSLSKSVLTDFEFYNSSYYPFYIVSIFLLYAVIIFTPVIRQNSLRYRKLFAISLVSLLLLITLANVSGPYIRDALIIVVSSPVGWILRSPLKWQLFIPFVISILIAITLTSYRKGMQTKVISVIFALLFVGMNGFVGIDYYEKLLTQKRINVFSQFAEQELDQKRALYVRNFDCGQALSARNDLSSELEYILQTSGLQTTYINQTDLTRYRVSDFDYVIDCTHSTFENQHRWSRLSLSTPLVDIYATNATAQDPVETVGFAWVGGDFNADTFHTILDQTDDTKVLLVDKASYANGEVHEIVNDVSKDDFGIGSISSKVEVQNDYGSIRLFSGANVDGEKIQINSSSIELQGTELTNIGTPSNARPIPNSNTYDIAYINPDYMFENLLDNPSFETGLWQEAVGDCYNYDNFPELSMDLNSDAAEGTTSLLLSAKRHIACVSAQNAIPVTPSQNMFISFKTKVLEGDNYAYTVKFNDVEQTSFERSIVVDRKGDWQEHTAFVQPPEGASNMTLLVYARPEEQGLNETTVLYDDFFVTSVPDINDKLYIAASDAPQQSNFASNVTKRSPVQFTATLTPQAGQAETYLVLKEKFHDGWEITSVNGTPTPAGFVNAHFSDLNGNNVWRLTDLDKQTGPMKIVISYTPQRAFYIGAILSFATLAATLTYLGLQQYEHKRVRQSKQTTGTT